MNITLTSTSLFGQNVDSQDESNKRMISAAEIAFTVLAIYLLAAFTILIAVPEQYVVFIQENILVGGLYIYFTIFFSTMGFRWIEGAYK